MRISPAQSHLPVLLWRDGWRLPKPLLLLPVEQFRRVYPLVSDLLAQSIQNRHP